MCTVSHFIRCSALGVSISAYSKGTFRGSFTKKGVSSSGKQVDTPESNCGTHYDAFVHSRTYLILGNDLDLASVSNGGSVPHDSHGLRFGHSVR